MVHVRIRATWHTIWFAARQYTRSGRVNGGRNRHVCGELQHWCIQFCGDHCPAQSICAEFDASADNQQYQREVRSNPTGFDVKYAQLEYVDLAIGAGLDNFELNATGLQVVGAPTNIVCPVGFQCSVTQYRIAGGVKGRIAITADPGNVVEKILIGGQELAIDNFHVVVPEPSGLLLVTMTLCSLAVGRRR